MWVSSRFFAAKLNYTLPINDVSGERMTIRERRVYRRISVNFWVSLSHPMLGVITCKIQDMSSGGLSVKLDEHLGFYHMMELDARMHGGNWDETMPSIPVQVVRIHGREIGLRFLDALDDSWSYTMLEDNSDFDYVEKYQESLSTY